MAPLATEKDVTENLNRCQNQCDRAVFSSLAVRISRRYITLTEYDLTRVVTIVRSCKRHLLQLTGTVL